MNEHAVGNAHLVHIQLRAQRAGEALVVGHGVVQTGRIQGDGGAQVAVDEADVRIFHAGLGLVEDAHLFAGAQIGGLHAGFIGGGDVRHFNDHIAQNAAVAGQTPTLGVFLIGYMAGFWGFQFALDQTDAALAAGAVAGTGSVDGDIRLAGDFQQVFLFSGKDFPVVAVLEAEDDFQHVATP